MKPLWKKLLDQALSYWSQGRRSILEAETIAALKENTKNPEYHVEVAAWNCVAKDGF
jgi:hypothetical protein